jgi:hypothetical protein
VNVLPGPPVEIRAVCNSAFEKGDATELFSYIKEGHKLGLAFYEIRPGIAKLALNEELMAAERAAAEFYERLSKGEYDAIYNSMSDDCRAATSKDEVTDHFGAINEKLGACSAPILTDTNFAQDGVNHLIGLKYTRACANREVNEHLAFKIVDGKALLLGYR